MKKHSKKAKKFLQATGIIIDECPRYVTPEELALRVGMDVKALITGFKKYTTMTLDEYYEDNRLQIARILLEKGLPVRVIVRSREKGTEFEKLGAEIAVADLQETDRANAGCNQRRAENVGPQHRRVW